MNLKQTLIAMFVLMLVTLFGFFYILESKTTQTVISTGATIPPAGYQPYPLQELKFYIKDAASPTTVVSTGTIKGTLYTISTPDSALSSPLTPYVDSATISSGAILFSSGKVMTGTSYKLKVWDDTSSPAWYPKLVSVNVPAFPSEVTSYTGDDVYLEKIGTFADPMQSDATGAGGASLPTGVTSSHATNTITINSTKITGDTFTIRIPLTFANTASGTKLRNVVLKPMQDTTTPIPVTAFSAATLTYVSGTNFNVASDILPYITSQQPIPLGDWTDGTAGTYYLQITMIKSVLNTDNAAFYFYIDDQGNWLATDPVAGQSGASPVYVKLFVDLA